MIVIDDNNLKLLKMNEKLLEISNVKSEKVLDDYKTMVVEVDQQAYLQIINKIKDNDNYYLKSFEEQLKYLSELDEDYIYLDELQHKFKKIYKDNANSDLELSNLDNILISRIRDRISCISGYLINVRNIEKNKLKLDKLNSSLIEEDKKKTLLQERLTNFEDKLRENLLRAEGRVYDKDGNAVYTSVSKEVELQLFKLLGDNIKDSDKLDLRTLLNDNGLLKEEINKALSDKSEAEESLEAAKICYDNVGGINNKDIYESIKIDTNKARYKYLLLSLVDVIASNQEDYNMVKEKRKKIIDLLNYRDKYINELNIKYLYDPFKRIGVKEQLQELDRIGTNDNTIKSIRRDINELSKMNDEMEKSNDELIRIIHEKMDFIHDDTRAHNVKTIDDNIEKISDNQVISIKTLNDSFIMSRVHEKTNGVIKRVIEMINSDFVSDDGITPELFIAKDDVKEYDDIWDNDSEEESNVELQMPSIDQDEPLTIMDEVFPDDNTEYKELEPEEIFKEEDDKSVDATSLFTEVQPFDDVSLFSEKTDDGIFDDRITKAMRPQTLTIDLNVDDKKNDFTKKITYEDQTENVREQFPKVVNDEFWVTKEEEENTKVRKLVT